MISCECVTKVCNQCSSWRTSEGQCILRYRELLARNPTSYDFEAETHPYHKNFEVPKECPYALEHALLREQKNEP